MTQLYYVDEDHADDPEASTHSLMDCLEIGRTYPMLAPFFEGDGTESLEYCHELWRLRIKPVEE